MRLWLAVRIFFKAACSTSFILINVQKDGGQEITFEGRILQEYHNLVGVLSLWQKKYGVQMKRDPSAGGKKVL